MSFIIELMKYFLSIFIEEINLMDLFQHFSALLTISVSMLPIISILNLNYVYLTQPVFQIIKTKFIKFVTFIINILFSSITTQLYDNLYTSNCSYVFNQNQYFQNYRLQSEIFLLPQISLRDIKIQVTKSIVAM